MQANFSYFQCSSQDILSSNVRKVDKKLNRFTDIAAANKSLADS